MKKSKQARVLAIATAAASVMSAGMVNAANYTWNNTAALLGGSPPQNGDTWGLASNWNTGGGTSVTVPSTDDTAVLPQYATITGLGPQLNAAYTVGAVSVNNTQADYTLGFGGGSGVSLTIGSATLGSANSGIFVTGGGTFTVQPQIALSQAQTWSVAGGSSMTFVRGFLASSGAVDITGGGFIQGPNATSARTGTTTVGGGTTIKTGFSGAFGTGNVTINDGVLELNVGSSVTTWNLQLNNGSTLRGYGSGVNAGTYNRSGGLGALPNGATIKFETGSASDQLQFGTNGVITGGNASTLIRADGPGTVIVGSGGGAYNGGWRLGSGALRLKVNGALGAGTRPLEAAGGRLELHGSPNAGSLGSPISFATNINVTGSTTFEIDRDSTANAGQLFRAVTSMQFGNVTANFRLGNNTPSGASGSTLATGNVTLVGSPTISVDNSTDGAKNYSMELRVGTISGSTNGFTKAGVGKMTLLNSNTYSGPTTVNGGTLQVNNTGGLGTTSAITVATGATLALTAGSTNNWTTSADLSGDGTISLTGGTGNTLTAQGSDVSPGSSPGTLTITGNLALGSGSTIQIEALGTTPDSEHDVLAVSSQLTGLNNADLEVDFTNADEELNGATITIITALTNFDTAPKFANAPTDGGVYQFDGGSAQVNYNNGSITLSNIAIPEPGSFMLLGLGALGFLQRRRRA